MAKRKVFHVVPDNNGWAVKTENASRAKSKHKTKQEAIEQATKDAKQQKPSQVKIHKKDGTFQGERTYGQDPYPPKG